MALQNTVEFRGIEFSAYCRITAVMVKSDNEAMVEVSYFKDQASQQIIYGEHFYFEHDKTQPFTFADGYQKIKSLEQFVGAIDILEDGQEAAMKD